MTARDAVENLTLIENGLLHMRFELARENPSFFRLGREAHLVLYRSMIEGLKGSANLAVTGRPPKDRKYQYQMGRDPWKEIHRTPIARCKRAWRFSDPQLCDAPALGERVTDPDEYLISFYDALAMIQTDCFMGQLVHSKTVPLSDDEMKTLEWLHERIRNEYEHFIPKYYSAPVADLTAAAHLSLKVSYGLLFDSGNVLFHAIARVDLQSLFDDVHGQARAEGNGKFNCSLKQTVGPTVFSAATGVYSGRCSRPLPSFSFIPAMEPKTKTIAPGNLVVLKKLPPGLAKGLPKKDQKAIREIVGKAVLLVEYDDDGRAELEFTDDTGATHFIYVNPEFIEAAP